MKKFVISTAIVVAIVLLWGGWNYSWRMRQNTAGGSMLVIKNALSDYVAEHRSWPQSWEQLFSNDTKGWAERVSRHVMVNWKMSIDEINQFVGALSEEDRNASSAPKRELPFIVKYTHRVPRDSSMELSERHWNWWIAQQIYRDVKLEPSGANNDGAIRQNAR